MSFYCIDCVDGEHSRAAIMVLADAVFEKPSRLRHPNVVGMARAQFRARLRRAVTGRLKDVEEVKRIRNEPRVSMFEIRWNDIAVIDRLNDGSQQRRVVAARLYYVELGDRVGVIAVHAHEKPFGSTATETREWQDEEIAVAVGVYWGRQSDGWGVPELGAS